MNLVAKEELCFAFSAFLRGEGEYITNQCGKTEAENVTA